MNEKPVRGFHHYGSAWYRLPDETILDYISVGLYYPSGGCDGEFMIEWTANGLGPRLCAFDDGWKTLGEFRDLLTLMAEHDNESLMPIQFIALLQQCGIIDLTSRERPAGPKTGTRA